MTSEPVYKVLIPRRILRRLERLPSSIQEKFLLLIEDLRDKVPIQRDWSNFSDLGTEGPKRLFHCHLNYSYVACWKHDKRTIEIEVYYAGSRQGASY